MPFSVRHNVDHPVSLYAATKKSNELMAHTYSNLFDVPVKLMDFITEIERHLGVEAEKHFMEIQPGDVPKTWADAEDLFGYIDYRPQVPVSEGIARFVAWYREYYGK